VGGTTIESWIDEAALEQCGYQNVTNPGTVRVFGQNFALEDAIGSHAFLSEVHCPYRCHHKSCLNTEGTEMDGDKGAEDVLSVYQIAHCVNNGSFHVTLEDVR